MNKNIFFIKFSILAYNEHKKLKNNSKLNENLFFAVFKESIENNTHFLNFVFNDEHVISQFLEDSVELCKFEALTFMPEESIDLYQQTKEKLKESIFHIEKQLTENSFYFTQNFTQDDWRKLIAVINTFKEWCNDIKYFNLSAEDKIRFLIESPLIAICHI